MSGLEPLGRLTSNERRAPLKQCERQNERFIPSAFPEIYIVRARAAVTRSNVTLAACSARVTLLQRLCQPERASHISSWSAAFSAIHEFSLMTARLREYLIGEA